MIDEYINKIFPLTIDDPSRLINLVELAHKYDNAKLLNVIINKYPSEKETFKNNKSEIENSLKNRTTNITRLLIKSIDNIKNKINFNTIKITSIEEFNSLLESVKLHLSERIITSNIKDSKNQTLLGACFNEFSSSIDLGINEMKSIKDIVEYSRGYNLDNFSDGRSPFIHLLDKLQLIDFTNDDLELVKEVIKSIGGRLNLSEPENRILTKIASSSSKSLLDSVKSLFVITHINDPSFNSGRNTFKNSNTNTPPNQKRSRGFEIG
jgi:hypothetical protein